MRETIKEANFFQLNSELHLHVLCANKSSPHGILYDKMRLLTSSTYIRQHMKPIFF